MLVLPDPGDFAAVNTLTVASSAIQLMQDLMGGGFSEYDHVACCTRIDTVGTVWIAEAEPGGAVERPWHYDSVPYRWSTGVIPTSQAVADAAVRYTRRGPWGRDGVPYSFADYAALAAHHWHIPAPGLRDFIEDGNHMMCSQLADRCFQDAGIQLWDDKRWNGFVTPADFGRLLTGKT